MEADKDTIGVYSVRYNNVLQVYSRYYIPRKRIAPTVDAINYLHRTSKSMFLYTNILMANSISSSLI